jgi:hypothetical protein
VLVRQLHTLFLAAAVLLLLASCSLTAEPDAPPHLEFAESVLDLGTLREGQIEVRNTGGQSVGPVELLVSGVRDANGATVPGSYLVIDPHEIPTLNAGTARVLSVSLSVQGSLIPGEYDGAITARGGQDTSAQTAVRFLVLDDRDSSAVSVEILSSRTTARVGDVVELPVEVRAANGTVFQGVPVSWSLVPPDAGYLGSNGQFVSYQTGNVTLVARAGAASDTLQLKVSERGLTGSFEIVGRAQESDRYTSDLWLHGTVAYAGTWGGRSVGEGINLGNTLNIWDIADPSSARKAVSLEIDARTVNDTKVRGDGALAVITHEGSDDGLNGVTILDLTNPLEPTPRGRFTTELESGVHNVWIEGNYAYLVVDGSGNGLRILDISDPDSPRVVASYWAGSSFLHDVYVRDGLAFLSHWNAGLIILDVGNGIVGGIPEAPVEISRLAALGGQTHNAWYWPETGYVFVGEEDFATPGILHVVDVRNLREPREVATYAVSGQTPHNHWLDEATGTLYVAWYGNGLRALDVSGDLLGELERQDRELVGLRYNGGFGSCNRPSQDTCAWAPQLHNGLVWVSDMNEGLIALQLTR